MPAEPGFGGRIEIALLVVMQAAPGGDVQVSDLAAGEPDLLSL